MTNGQEFKEGDHVQMTTSGGFLPADTVYVVLEARGNRDTGLCVIRSVNAQDGGILSHLNSKMVGNSLLKMATNQPTTKLETNQ